MSELMKRPVRSVKVLERLLAEAEEGAKDAGKTVNIIEVRVAGALGAGVVRCRYLQLDGRECGMEAEAGSDWCSLHLEWDRLQLAQRGFTCPEDAASLQVFLLKMLDVVLYGRMMQSSHRMVERLCRLLAANTRAVEWERRRRRG